VWADDAEPIGNKEQPPMIRMKNVSKIYRTEHVETHALSGFTVEIADGEFVAVMGPSGSGKTTFLNMAGLLDTFDQGTYWLDGNDVSKLSDRQASKLRNEKIGFIFQSFNLIPDLDVRDNVDVPLRYRGMPAKQRRVAIEGALEVVGLTSRIRHYPAQLSGGQQQRVAVARALVGKPRLILADEPTGNLDSAMANEILDLLERINASGTTVVMVTHDPELAARAPRQIHVLDGRMLDLATEVAQPLFEPARIGGAVPALGV
jgi:putative ABC transport system ATP-binding protein